MVLLFTIPTAAEMIRALSWTLVHSMWLGVLLSITAAVIIYTTKKSRPQIRYNLLAAALLFFVLAAAVIFSMQVDKASQLNASIQLATTEQDKPVDLQLLTTGAEGNTSLLNIFAAFVDTNAASIALMWLVIISLQFMRLTAGLYGVYRLKSRQVSAAGEYWNGRVATLSRQLGIKKAVQFLQSGIVKMPAAIGYFKPVILFPAGMLASLPPAEVEAVLLHELAHIRRHDFLINLLQQLAEIIFFFNPAVWWVSSLLKSERENCCDDMAMLQTGNRQNYIKALLSFQAFDLPPAVAPAVGFTGEKNQLLNRVKRIINNNNKTLNNMEKKLLAAGVIITSALLFSFSPGNAWQKPLDKIMASEENEASHIQQDKVGQALQTDTVPAPAAATEELINGEINSTQNGKRYRLITEQNQVKELYVNDKKIPAEKLDDYRKITDKILTDAKVELAQSQKEMAEAAIELEQSKKEMEESKLELAQSQKEMAEAAAELGQSKKEMAEAANQMTLDKVQSDKDLEQAKHDMAESKQNLALAKIELEKAQKEMEADLKRSKLDMEQSAKDMAQAKKDMEQAKRDEAAAKQDEKEAAVLQEKIISDLISEHFISSKSDLQSFELSDEKMVVNGVQQPEDVFKKFKAKYVKSKHASMLFNYR